MSYVKQAAAKIPGAQQKIAEVVLSASQASIDFSATPQNYRHLRLVASIRGDAAGASTGGLLQFNGDTSSNYSEQVAYGQASSTGSYTGTGTSIGLDNLNAAGATAGHFSPVDIDIYNYTSGQPKSGFFRQYHQDNTYLTGGFTWGGTAPISSIHLALASGNFAAGTVVTLYGVDDLSASTVTSTVTGAQPSSKVQLDWTATTDIANAAAVAATTWTDVPGSNQTFTVDDAASLVDITAWGNVRIVQSGGNAANTRLVIDSGGSAITKMLGGVSSTTDGNALAGADPVTLSGLSAGTHTVKVQVYAGYSGGGTLYVRAASQPNSEVFGIRVVERKQIAPTTYTPVTNQTNKVQLAWSATTDIAPAGTTLAAGTWTDVPGSSQTFAVDDAASLVEIEADGFITVYGSNNTTAAFRLVVDGTTNSPNLGGTYVTASTTFPNVLGGGGRYGFSGLSAGSHTVKVQVWVGSASSMACRASSNPPEALTLRVIERKTTTSAAVSTALGSASNALAADVTTTTAGVYYDGPGVSLGAGTWFVTSTITVFNSTGGLTLGMAKLWDGTTVYASTESTEGTNGEDYTYTLSALVTLTAPITVKTSFAHNNGGGRIVAAIQDGGAPGKASQINAIRVA